MIETGGLAVPLTGDMIRSQGRTMTTPYQSRAAMLQLIAEGMRSTAGDRLQPGQLHRIAGLLDRIAVDLLVPTTPDDDEPFGTFALEPERRNSLHS
jgi:hypothetical protein